MVMRRRQLQAITEDVRQVTLCRGRGEKQSRNSNQNLLLSTIVISIPSYFHLISCVYCTIAFPHPAQAVAPSPVSVNYKSLRSTKELIVTIILMNSNALSCTNNNFTTKFLLFRL